jgi:hypothetical protein
LRALIHVKWRRSLRYATPNDIAEGIWFFVLPRSGRLAIFRNDRFRRFSDIRREPPQRLQCAVSGHPHERDQTAEAEPPACLASTEAPNFQNEWSMALLSAQAITINVSPIITIVNTTLDIGARPIMRGQGAAGSWPL